MKKAKNRILSFLTAFAMVIGVLVAPFTSANAAPGDETTNQTKVRIHKILMDEKDFNKENADGSSVWPKDHDGSVINNITEYFGTSAKPINGVAFRIYEVYTGEEENPAGYTKGSDLITSDKLVANDLDANKFYKLVQVDNKDFVLSKTVGEENGIAEVTLPDGSYRIVEDKANSTYKGEKGKVLTGAKAVPFDLVLPAGLPDGTGNYSVEKPLNVYPKNTENAPQIDKNFKKDNDLTAAEGYDADNLLKVGADYKNYEAKKSTAEAEIGKNIPYEVKTEIPAKSKLAEAKWDDKMTEGLTYNKDLTVKIGDETITPTVDELTQTDNGFVLRLQGENLKKLNGKEAAVTVVLTYSATVNSKAIVDIPEANDVKFFYGNTPSKGTTPLPTKPNDKGEVTVEKTWDEGSNFVDGEWADFKLVDANTGEDVKVSDLVEPTKEEEKAAFNEYKSEFEKLINEKSGVVRLQKGQNTATHTWKYLNKDKQYKVIEVDSQTLSDAEYTKAADGTIKITNHKSNNPKPLNPTEPKVVLGGKKFVKTDSDGTERLAGAEFVIQNKNDGADKDKYLEATGIDGTEYTTADKAYNDAIKAVNDALAKGEISTTNKAIVAGQEYESKESALAKVEELRVARDKAFGKNALAYTWVDDIKQATTFTSNNAGQFEVRGIEYGEYRAVETKAPAGFALPTDGGNFTFTVAKGTYTSKGDIDYVADSTNNDAMKIINNKVTIPQTGGIGSLIFIVAGLAIMGLAFVMKRRNAVEA